MQNPIQLYTKQFYKASSPKKLSRKPTELENVVQPLTQVTKKATRQIYM